LVPRSRKSNATQPDRERAVRIAFIVPEGRCDRSLARSARGKGPSKDPSRRVRYDRASESQKYFSSKCAPCFLRKANPLLERFVSDDVRAAARWNGPFPEPARIGAHTCTNRTVPSGTALFGWRRPRHFVPGYDHIVPPGHFAKGFSHIQNRVAEVKRGPLVAK
jgi:hypothetical protein